MCTGTETRSNPKLLIVPCFLLSNLGLYLSISLLRVSLIMQTKHKKRVKRANNSWPPCSSCNGRNSHRRRTGDINSNYCCGHGSKLWVGGRYEPRKENHLSLGSFSFCLDEISKVMKLKNIQGHEWPLLFTLLYPLKLHVPDVILFCLSFQFDFLQQCILLLNNWTRY